MIPFDFQPAKPSFHTDSIVRGDMNASQDAVGGFSLGVLIIGSLFWDPERDAWRQKRLDVDKRHRVRAPIRYGRCSSTRDNTYTMVFSPTLDEACFGQAIALPCRSHDLVQEAKCLWAAESNGKGGVSASWGCVGLLPNPDSARLLSEPCKRWREFVRECGERSSNYRELAKVNAGVNEDGLLTIPWPKLTNGSTLAFDALLATATNPTIVGGCYPSAQQIADAWNTPVGKRHVDYFCKNRAHGIKTFQDTEIEDRLRELWQ